MRETLPRFSIGAVLQTQHLNDMVDRLNALTQDQRTSNGALALAATGLVAAGTTRRLSRRSFLGLGRKAR